MKITRVKLKRNFARYKYIYLMLLPVLIYYGIFCYGPMGGTVIAFQNYKPALGIEGSPWVGLKHFPGFPDWPLCMAVNQKYAAYQYTANSVCFSDSYYTGSSHQ